MSETSILGNRCMLVLARKKNEAILIGGVIRIDVVNVSRATVRLRLQAPRSMKLGRMAATTTARQPVREDSEDLLGPVGLDVVLVTLVNQQVISLGETISLGVVDADRSRALLFVDAPNGTSVTAVKPQEHPGESSGTRQNLLQFMGPCPEKNGITPGPWSKVLAYPEPVKPCQAQESLPDLLPFPVPTAHRTRS